MNEGRTSAIFALVAAVTFGLAWMSRPVSVSDENDLKQQRVGQPVFAKFEDPDEAASFQIVRYDESLGQLERFEVAKDKSSSMWKLPSYEDYPADAAEQVRDATTPLISLPILNVASLDRGDHSLYGVVDPDNENLSVGESGVGMMVRVKGASNQVLAELIIGKEVPATEGQRYVRIPTEDATYVVELDTAPFTTDFQKWINQELLDVRSFDIASVDLRDYAIVPTQQGYGMSRNFDADVSYDSAENKWKLDRLVSYENGKAEEVGLDEGEVLNETALNDLRNAVQDLEIVNVRRKPTGLSANLKAEQSLMQNQESVQSLVSQGFIPQEGPEGTEIFATGGETLVGTAAGVKYLLRFGEAVAKLGSIGEDGEEESGLRRYLLVSAALDDSKFPPPDLEPLPETVEEMLAAQKADEPQDAATETPTDSSPVDSPLEETVDSDAAPASEDPTSDPKADGNAADEAEAVNDKSPDTTEKPAVEEVAPESDTGTETPDSSDEGVPGERPPKPVAFINQAEQAEVSQQSSGETGNAEQANEAGEDTTEQEADGENAEAAPESGDAASDAESAESTEKTREELEEELEFVREKIAKENQRKIDERNEKLEEARKRVRELNARFADWYYVVSDNVYKKLKISRDQLTNTAAEQAAQDAAAPQQPGGMQFPGGMPPGFSFPQN